MLDEASEGTYHDRFPEVSVWTDSEVNCRMLDDNYCLSSLSISAMVSWVIAHYVKLSVYYIEELAVMPYI